ncbi:MAG TPA: hypothetical protein PKV72_02630 [Candidatus Peribacteria bacterium]|nr:hypothetical protein [Candidatus Peribacteria bacterium]
MLNFAQLKKFCISAFVGSLIAAALAAVVTVLIGEFNEITGRVFATLLVVVLHSLVSLSFIWDDSRSATFTRLAFFINTVFVIIVMSFVASVFSIWHIISWETLRHLYETFFLLGFAALHADILSKARGKEKYMDTMIHANYAFMAVVVLMLQPLIYIQNAPEILGPLFFRVIAAAAIIDGTLSILTIIFYKLYLHKHPEVPDAFAPTQAIIAAQPVKKGGISFWMALLILFVVFQVIIPIFWMVARIPYHNL